MYYASCCRSTWAWPVCYKHACVVSVIVAEDMLANQTPDKCCFNYTVGVAAQAAAVGVVRMPASSYTHLLSVIMGTAARL